MHIQAGAHNDHPSLVMPLDTQAKSHNGDAKLGHRVTQWTPLGSENCVTRLGYSIA